MVGGEEAMGRGDPTLVSWKDQHFQQQPLKLRLGRETAGDVLRQLEDGSGQGL
jgi:hypothetical protein